MAFLEKLSPKWAHIVRHALWTGAFLLVAMSAYEWFFEDGTDWLRHLLVGAVVYTPFGLLSGWHDWRTRERLRIEREAWEREDEAQREATRVLMESRER
jgi:hypothetical protein